LKTLSRSFQLRLCLLFLLPGSAAGCVAGGALVHTDTAQLVQAGLPSTGLRPGNGGDTETQASLKAGTTEAGIATDAGIAWFGPPKVGDTGRLARSRPSVGPPVVQVASPRTDTPLDDITIVSWNTAVGEADVVRFVRALPRGPIVLLLQEVYRGGPEVPSQLAPAFAFAGHLGGAAGGPDCREIEDVAARLALNVYYVPSMRNGGVTSNEDRGNAILSNLPLTDLRAVELPFERQRRVAVAATINGRTTSGTPWRVRLVSAHLDNMSTIRRVWIGAEYGRARQARELAALLQDSEPTILAGDFNTWFGFSDRAYLETAHAFPQTTVVDRRATFRGLLRLDHVFFRLQPGWRAEFRRAESRFGSDHYPLLGTLQFN
jgi:endonuclease/exonuclease/phosphatase family metal-dependent hydrolase